MNIHPRHVQIKEASRVLNEFLLDWEDTHQLTEIETACILSEILSKYLNFIKRGDE